MSSHQAEQAATLYPAGMSSKASILRPSKAVRAATASLPSSSDKILAEQLAKLLAAHPGAIELLAVVLSQHPLLTTACQACSEQATPTQRASQSVVDVEGSDALITLDAVKKMTGLGKTRIYALVRQGQFPAPYKPGGTSSRWNIAEVQAWRSTLKVTRDTKQARPSPAHCGLPGPLAAQRIGPPSRVSGDAMPWRSTSAHS